MKIALFVTMILASLVGAIVAYLRLGEPTNWTSVAWPLNTLVWCVIALVTDRRK